MYVCMYDVLQVCTDSRCTGFATICTYVPMYSIDSLKRLDMLRYTVILRHERGQGNIRGFFPVQLTTCRTGNLTRLINTLAICVTIHVP